MENINKDINVLTLSDSIHVVKENKTEVNYFLFSEYEIHINKIPPKAIQDWHYHSNIEEVILVNKGILTCKWLIDNKIETKHINKNQLVQVNNSIHTFENITEEDVEFTVFRLVLEGTDKREKMKNDKIIVNNIQ